MNTVARSNPLLIIVAVLIILPLGQPVHALDHCSPLWVKDRQQYQPNYVYAGPAHTPQWVRDRQQYQPSYVFELPSCDAQPAETTAPIPQWVVDRQQYQPGYIYVPPTAE